VLLARAVLARRVLRRFAIEDVDRVNVRDVRKSRSSWIDLAGRI